MPTLKTLKAHRYGGKPLVPGDEFEARDRDVRILTALGRAERVVVAPAVEPEEEDAPEVAGEKPKRRYKRRDLTAE